MIRKLPSDHDLANIIRFGFSYTDIANRFQVTVQAVSEHATRLGFGPIDPVSMQRCARRPSVTARVFLSHIRAA
jgi:hypothetical protein